MRVLKLRTRIAMVVVGAATVLALSGCAGGASSTYTGPTNSIPGQDEALSIILSAYQAEAFEVPPIVWRYNDICNGLPGWKADGGSCIAGQYNPVENFIQIEYTSPMISNSGLPHEMAHAAHAFMNDGDCDTNHQSIYFNGSSFYYGNAGSLLEAARANLIARGL